MAFMYALGSCCACGTGIAFNPNKVPSLRVNGVREPICRACFEQWNQIHRTSKGLDPVELSPDAYEPEPVS